MKLAGYTVNEITVLTAAPCCVLEPSSMLVGQSVCAANWVGTTSSAKVTAYAKVPASKANGFSPRKINKCKGLPVSELEHSGFQSKN